MPSASASVMRQVESLSLTDVSGDATTILMGDIHISGDFDEQGKPKHYPYNPICFEQYQQLITEAEVDHSWDHMVPQADEVFDLWKSVGKPEGDALGETYGFTSVYQARAIRTRAAKGASEQLEIGAFSIGDMGFTTGTYEMFTDSSLYVKENSPFETTFVMTCANGGNNYIASEYAFESGGTYEVHNRIFPKGTAEALASTYVEMLKSLNS